MLAALAPASAYTQVFPDCEHFGRIFYNMVCGARCPPVFLSSADTLPCNRLTSPARASRRSRSCTASPSPAARTCPRWQTRPSSSRIRAASSSPAHRSSRPRPVRARVSRARALARARRARGRRRRPEHGRGRERGALAASRAHARRARRRQAPPGPLPHRARRLLQPPPRDRRTPTTVGSRLLCGARDADSAADHRRDESRARHAPLSRHQSEDGKCAG
jgi:hypothetical protein